MNTNKKSRFGVFTLFVFTIAFVIIGSLIIIRLDKIIDYQEKENGKITYEKLKGKQYENKYENELLGLGFKLPEGWEFVEVYKASNETDANKSEEEKCQYGYSMEAKGDDCVVIIGYEEIPIGDLLYETTKEYIEGIINEVEAETLIREISISGKRYYGYDVVWPTDKGTIYKTYVFKKLDTHTISFCISSSQKEKVETALKYIYVLDN